MVIAATQSERTICDMTQVNRLQDRVAFLHFASQFTQLVDELRVHIGHLQTASNQARDTPRAAMLPAG